MKIMKLNKLFAGYLIIIILASCNKPPCKCDFVPINFLEIRFVNLQGQNLFFGNNALYKMDSVRVLKERGNFNINNASVRKGIADSNSVRFDFYIPADKSYIYYNGQSSQDSLEVKWLSETGKCCNSDHQYYTVDSVKFNGTLMKPENGIYYFVK